MPAPAPLSPGNGATATPGTTPAPQRPKRDERLFSDQPIPFNLLRTANVDLTVAFADVHGGGTEYKAVNAHAVVKDGKLALDPFAANLPGGHLSGSVTG